MNFDILMFKDRRLSFRQSANTVQVNPIDASLMKLMSKKNSPEGKHQNIFHHVARGCLARVRVTLAIEIHKTNRLAGLF